MMIHETKSETGHTSPLSIAWDYGAVLLDTLILFCNHSYATTLRNLNFRMIRQANAKYINRFVRQASASTTIPIPTKPVYRDLDPGWWYKLIIILVCSYRMNHTVWIIRHPAKKHEKFMTEWFELITLVNVVPMLFIMDSGMFWKIQILVISSRLDYPVLFTETFASIKMEFKSL